MTPKGDAQAHFVPLAGAVGKPAEPAVGPPIALGAFRTLALKILVSGSLSVQSQKRDDSVVLNLNAMAFCDRSHPQACGDQIRCCLQKQRSAAPSEQGQQVRGGFPTGHVPVVGSGTVMMIAWLKPSTSDDRQAARHSKNLPLQLRTS